MKKNRLGLGSYIGIGLCMFAFTGLTPFAFENLGLSLEVGISLTGFIMGILIPCLFYFKSKEDEIEWKIKRR